MISGEEAIRTLVESAEPDLWRSVRVALSLAADKEAELQLLRAVESRRNVGCRWLRAALIEKLNGSEAAKPLWEEVVTQNGCQIPDVLLQRARTLTREGDIIGAAALMRLALQNTHDYGFYVRSETVARKCRAGFGLNRSLKIALLGSSTTSFLSGVLELLLLRDGIAAEFYEPPFGTYAQELLQSPSGLERFEPDFTVLLLNWRDLGLPSNAADNSERDKVVDRIKGLWRAAMESQPGKLIQLTFTPPLHDASHALSFLMPNGRGRSIRQINEDLYASAPDRVMLIDSERLAASWNGPWEDCLAWSSSKVYPAPAILPAVGEQIASCIRAEIGLARRLLVLDADNTLWGGVIGEDELNGIRLGSPSAIGERYQAFQQYLKELKQRGVLLAIASKNNLHEVTDVLSRHASAVLKPDDFVSVKVNWQDKVTNIREIASDLRLGLDSIVFLDDNPAERLAIRRELPDIVVPEISGEPMESIAALENGLYFQSVRLTQEDIARNASYLANAKQTTLVKSTAGFDQYLSDLGMKVTYGPVDSETLVRVSQLINKTNQFNLTTPRHSEEEVRRRMRSPAYWCRRYRLEDRFADHGLIGVLIVGIVGTTWTVDTWLMSCRVIGREIESFMLRDLVLAAREARAKSIVAHYIATAKNGLVSQLLPRLGFVQGSQPNDFVLDVSTAILPECKFLRVDAAISKTRVDGELAEERPISL